MAKKDCWDKIQIIATIIIALVAIGGFIYTIVTLDQTKKIWKTQLEIDRPYFSVIDSVGIHFMIDPQNEVYIIRSSMINLGKRPAADYQGILYVIEKDSNRIAYIDTSTIANEISPNGHLFLPLRSFGTRDLNKIPKLYLKWKISYSDPINEGKTYTQEFYFVWLKIIYTNADIIEPNFVLAEKEDIKKIDEIISD